MLVGDLIYNDGFECNCNYAIYTSLEKDNVYWGDKYPVWSTLTHGYRKPPCWLLDKEIGYVTTDTKDGCLIIEYKE